MTYQEWLTHLNALNVSVKEALADLEITPQAVYKWRKGGEVSKLAMLYLRQLKTRTKSSQEILAERHAEYGAFADQMADLLRFKRGITIKVTYKDATESAQQEVIESALDFIKNILALKAARSMSTTISDDNYRDSIVDFINYYDLLDRYLAENCKTHEVTFSDPFRFTSIDAIRQESMVASLSKIGLGS